MSILSDIYKRTINWASEKEVALWNTINELVNGKYKTYVAVLSQTGTNAPTAIIVNNDFTGVNFTWSYVGVGSYLVTTDSPVLTASKTFVFFQHRDNNNTYPIVTWNSNQQTTSVIDLKNKAIGGTITNGTVVDGTVTGGVLANLTVSSGTLTISSVNGIMTYAPIEIRVYN